MNVRYEDWHTHISRQLTLHYRFKLAFTADVLYSRGVEKERYNGPVSGKKSNIPTVVVCLVWRD